MLLYNIIICKGIFERMIDKLLDILKLFLEKFLIPTIISVVMTFLIYFATPIEHNLIAKFTLTGYCVFVFCICFLIVSLCKYIGKHSIVFIKNIFTKRHNRIKEQKNIDECRRITMEKMAKEFRKTVNKFSPKDRELLREFYKTNNKPIERSTEQHFMDYTLLGSQMVESTIIKENQKQLINVHRDSEKLNFIPINNYETIYGTKAYWLKEEIFEILKYSMETTGKVSEID